MPAHVLTRQVDGFQRHREVVVDVITDAEVDLVFIEVQTGSYFGEDDIERLEDDFGRG